MIFNSFSYDRNVYKKKNVVICVYVLQIMEISEAVEPIPGKIAAVLQD